METGPIVLLRGELTGQGRQASCEVLARKSTGAVLSAYTECSVIGVSGDLPDGPYTVHFDGYRLEVKQRNGIWFPQGEPIRADDPPAHADPGTLEHLSR